MPLPAHNTAERLIRLALRDAGRLQTGQEPSTEVFDDALSRLTDILNYLQTKGLKLWLNQILEITLVAGTGSYTLGPAGAIITLKPYRVTAGWYVSSSGARRELDILSWTDYHNLGTITQQGEINGFFVDKQKSNLVVKTWQVPSTSAATGKLQLQIQRQAVTPATITAEVDFPPEWFIALRWCLADDLSAGQPIPIMERNKANALRYTAELEDWDVEDDSVQFAYQGGSR